MQSVIYRLQLGTNTFIGRSDDMAQQLPAVTIVVQWRALMVQICPLYSVVLCSMGPSSLRGNVAFSFLSSPENSNTMPTLSM